MLMDLGCCLCGRSWSGREGWGGSLPLPKWAPPLSRSKEGRRGSRKVCFSPSSPTPFGAHGGNFSRATITLVADNSNVLINAHRHASSSSFSCSTPLLEGLRQSKHLRDLQGKGWMRSRRYKVTLQHFQSDYMRNSQNFAHIADQVKNVGTFWFRVAKGGRGLTDGEKFEAASWSVGGPREIFQCSSFLLSFVRCRE